MITNTGPSDARNVVITDALPAQVSYVGGSPECTHNGAPTDGLVTCQLGTLLAGESRDFLVNTRVLSNVENNTTATNYVTATTTTTSTLFTANEQTTYLQKAGNPTDLGLTKVATPTSVVAGSGRVTYTLVVTNGGPAEANAVQVVDAFPRDFRFVSATASDGSLCNGGVVCDLGVMTVGKRVTITVVMDVPSNVGAGVYTNTATVGSASPDSTPGNNTASAPVTVTLNAVLQVRKVANPSPAIPGQDLNYTILVTNTGPSDAQNVTVTDTLPASYTLALLTSSQGGCASLTCTLGTIPAGGNAMIWINGKVAAGATGSITNTATVSSATPGTSDDLHRRHPPDDGRRPAAGQDRHAHGQPRRHRGLHDHGAQPGSRRCRQCDHHRHPAGGSHLWRRAQLFGQRQRGDLHNRHIGPERQRAAYGHSHSQWHGGAGHEPGEQRHRFQHDG